MRCKLQQNRLTQYYKQGLSVKNWNVEEAVNHCQTNHQFRRPGGEPSTSCPSICRQKAGPSAEGGSKQASDER